MSCFDVLFLFKNRTSKHVMFSSGRNRTCFMSYSVFHYRTCRKQDMQNMSCFGMSCFGHVLFSVGGLCSPRWLLSATVFPACIVFGLDNSIRNYESQSPRFVGSGAPRIVIRVMFPAPFPEPVVAVVLSCFWKVMSCPPVAC